ncbi:MAG: plasma-membrane proton-efflux P-type ATPase [Hyphomicrobiaceae bacterium]
MNLTKRGKEKTSEATPSGDQKPPAVPPADLSTDLKIGLSNSEAAARLLKYGPNALAEKKTSALARLMHYFWGPIPWMIETAALLSAFLGDWADFAIILTMLLVNAGVDFWQEHKAGSAIEALKQRLALSARVLRDSTWQNIPASDLVPGDVIALKLGNVVPADLVLKTGDYLSVDESALTGESLPVDKRAGDSAYSGSIAKLGEMQAIVTATGMKTYFGKTAQLVESAQAHSHFQTAVLKIGNFLIATTLVLVAIIIAFAVWRHERLIETIQFALILTVAAIPVALPTVLSVTLAVGAERLARMKAIVSRLVSIEELAGVDVLCADKTGTLTRNQLTISDLRPTASATDDDLLLAAALASNKDDPDAIDGAVLAAQSKTASLDGWKMLAFTPFDPISKRTEARAAKNGDTYLFSKGAPQVILDLVTLSPDERKACEREVDDLANDGYRALGVAQKHEGGPWTYLGVIPIFDPPREDAASTIARARSMGINVKMITGDHEAIARQIAGKLGLGRNIQSAAALFDQDGDIARRIDAVDGVARVLPEHKFKIVKALQDSGHLVAMTGDGVNDAPALKQADAGIAVSGASDAARAAADVVLTGSGLSVITSAIEEARRIFERMTSYATFRIAETIRVLLFMTLSILIFRFYPVTAIMIVLLAILNDLPIMTIAYDNAATAKAPVKWDMRRVLILSTALGFVGVIETFLLFWYVDTVLKIPRETIQTLIFLKLLVAGHLTLYVARSQGWFWQQPWPNPRLFLTTEATQILGTLIAVYGIFITPLGWKYALAVWAYALAWLPIENVIANIVRSRLSATNT